MIRTYMVLKDTEYGNLSGIEENEQKSIQNNIKILPDRSQVAQVCLSLLVFLLSSNTSIENEEVIHSPPPARGKR